MDFQREAMTLSAPSLEPSTRRQEAPLKDNLELDIHHAHLSAKHSNHFDICETEAYIIDHLRPATNGPCIKLMQSTNRPSVRQIALIQIL